MKKTKLLIIGLVLICFSMRAPMSVVGPLISQIKTSLNLSSALAGMLTSILMLFLGIVSPFGGLLMSKFNFKRLFILSLLAVLGGILLRSYLKMAGLVLGTALIGLGIGILNVSVPVWIRIRFPEDIGRVMGIYSVSMTALSAIASGICVKLSDLLSGWQNAMAIFVIFPAAALLLWLFILPDDPENLEKTKSSSFRSILSSFSNWSSALFMGLQSTLFFCMISWLPSILNERGFSFSQGGEMTFLMQMTSLLTNYLMPVCFQKYPARRNLLGISCAVFYVSGLIMLLLPSHPIWQMILAVILLGLSSGLSFSFALSVIAMKGKNSSETAGLSAFVQCFGYLFSAPAPTVLGSLYDKSGSFTLPLVFLLLVCIPLGFFACFSLKKSSE